MMETMIQTLPETLSFSRRVSRRERFARPTRLARRPDLWIVDDFLTADEIAGALDRAGDARWVARRALHVITDERCFAAEVPADGRGLFGQIFRRIERLTEVRSSRPRTLRFKYNRNGEGHRLHSDAFTHEGHHVVMSSLIYLTDVEAGGETIFPHAVPGGLAVAPRRGRLLVWTSLDEQGVVDPAGFHGAAPVLEGEKAVLVGFSLKPVGQTLTRIWPERPAPAPAQKRYA